MSIPTYTPGYPPDNSTLGQTKSTVRNNLDGTFLTLAVDHVNNNGQPGSQPAGYHTIIHEVPQTSVSTLTGYNQVFTGVPGSLVVNATTTPAIPANGDTQLYSLSSLGALAQLTGFSAATNGYAWVGGILVQWGRTSAPTSGVAISFPVTFPNACFTVIATPYKSGAISNLTGFGIAAPATTTTFTPIFSGTTLDYVGWVAIGK